MASGREGGLFWDFANCSREATVLYKHFQGGESCKDKREMEFGGELFRERWGRCRPSGCHLMKTTLKRILRSSGNKDTDFPNVPGIAYPRPFFSFPYFLS